MPKPADKFISIEGNKLSLNKPGNYSFDFTGNGVAISRGGSTSLTDQQWNTLTELDLGQSNKISISGISFSEASASGGFDTDSNVNILIGAMLDTYGVAETLDRLSVNDSDADTFKLLWDYLDDAYVAGANYYNLPLNEMFVRLGVEYVEYLESGGEPLTFVIAKFTADGGDPGTLPDRLQSMHDNLLGNLEPASIDDKFGSDPDLKAELLDLIPDEYETRPRFSGDESALGGAAHDGARAFDYDNGWDRPDYIDANTNGVVDPLARDPGSPTQMLYGSGNPTDDWNLIRHEGAQVELALKIKHRGGDEYAEAGQDESGLWHYDVLGGTGSTSNRAEWNFDFSATDYSPDQDFNFVLELDLDPSENEQWMTLYSSGAPLDSDIGDGSLLQNSSNIAFYRNFIDTDANAEGIQPYAFGAGEFNVRLSAFDLESGLLVARHEVVVHVQPDVFP